MARICGQSYGADTMKEASQTPGENQHAPRSVRASPPPSILVVDDDAFIVHFNHKLLAASGYQVDTAPDGEAAWAKLQHSSYDLLITDNHMPNVCGVELIQKVRTARMALVIIMASGAPPMDRFADAPWLHPEAVLAKPYSGLQLLDTVETVLGIPKDGQTRLAFTPTGRAGPQSTVGT